MQLSSVQAKRTQRTAFVGGQVLLGEEVFRWFLRILDNYARWDTVASLEKYFPVCSSLWFTPVAVLGIFVLLMSSQRIAAQTETSIPKIVDANNTPYVKVDWRWLWVSCAVLLLAGAGATLYGTWWLRTYVPPAISWKLPAPSAPEIYKTSRGGALPSLHAAGTISIQQHSEGPNSPNIIGSGNQVTINPKPLSRRIPAGYRAQLVSFLSEKPARVRISAIINDPEAYQFAEDWYTVFHDARWTIEEDRISMFISAGPPQSGVLVKMHGESVIPNQRFEVSNSDPAGYIARALTALSVTFSGQRYPDIDEGLVVMEFYAQPPSQ